jgi:hypothetical protein
LIKAGVTPDIRRTAEDVERSRTALMSAGGGIGKMVELGLPLIMWVIEGCVRGVTDASELTR